MIKIVLAGASTYGVKNMGDDAMLINLVDELHRQVDCEITFLARHPSKEYDELYKLRSIKNFEFDTKEASKGKWFYGFNPDDSKNHLVSIQESIKEADLVIIGGNSFMEVSPNQFMRGVSSYSSLVATIAMLNNKPYVLYGVAGHELENEATKEMARYLCSNAKLVTVREEFFKEALIKAGVELNNVEVFGDPVYGVELGGNEDLVANDLLKRENINLGNKPLIGIGFRHMYWVWDDEEFDKNAEKLVGICDDLIENLDVEILFIPNCTYTLANKYQDDRVINDILFPMFRNSKSVHMIKGDLNLKETLALYSKIDCIFSNRRHSSIFGALHYKPMVSFSTGHGWHFHPFIKELGLDVDDHLVDFETDSLEVIVKKIDSVIKNKELIQKKYQEKMPYLKSRAQQQVDRILEVTDLLSS